MDKYRKILKAVRGKQQEKDQEKQARDIAETMCLSVDESPHMIAMEDGAAAIAAMYTLCVDDGLNTVAEYLELKDRLDGLLGDMHDKMREIYPVPAQRDPGDKSMPCIGADAVQEECIRYGWIVTPRSTHLLSAGFPARMT